MTDGALSIALVADPYLPVPPVLYGGIERIIAFLIEGLVERGHRVVLWGHPRSEVPCELVAYSEPSHEGRFNRARDLAQVMGGLGRRRTEFDLIHNFGRLAGLLPLFRSRVPKIQSYQRAITARNISVAVRMAGDSLSFTSCSTNSRRNVSHLGRWRTVYNGVKLRDFEFRNEVDGDAPLVFLGRIERIKGPHTAISVAYATGRRLLIAGNIPEGGEHQRYFDKEIAPHVNGEQIQFVGPVDDRQKNELLGLAAALLMPIEWEEPFGIVMVEALACGTPVIALRRGSVPEVVEHGVSGFVSTTVEQMIVDVGRIETLNRCDARARAVRQFSDRTIVDAYERLYREEIGRGLR